MPNIDDVIETYNLFVKVYDGEFDLEDEPDITVSDALAFVKGKLQEHIIEEIVRIVWQNLGGLENRLMINSNKIHIPI